MSNDRAVHPASAGVASLRRTATAAAASGTALVGLFAAALRLGSLLVLAAIAGLVAVAASWRATTAARGAGSDLDVPTIGAGLLGAGLVGLLIGWQLAERLIAV
jgi:hypothetical protein